MLLGPLSDIMKSQHRRETMKNLRLGPGSGDGSGGNDGSGDRDGGN